MSFTNDPANSAVDRIRLFVGDTLAYPEWLSDETYTYLLDKYNDNESLSAVEAAKYILAQLTHYTRERAGEVEVYGDVYFKNYKEFLTQLIQDPTITLSSATPYAGGISKSDMESNDCNSDNVTSRFYRGFASGKRVWDE